jgi:hypothetical protein
MNQLTVFGVAAGEKSGNNSPFKIRQHFKVRSQHIVQCAQHIDPLANVDVIRGQDGVEAEHGNYIVLLR